MRTRTSDIQSYDDRARRRIVAPTLRRFTNVVSVTIPSRLRAYYSL